MEIYPQKHSFSSFETNQLKNSGFSIKSNTQETLEDFINRVYPNFNLAFFLLKIDELLSKTTTQDIEKIIEFDSTSGNLDFLYRSFNDDLILFRNFTKDISNKIEVEHAFFLLPLNFQNKGIAKSIFQLSIQEYINMNLSLIKVHAALHEGGYTWARCGFVAVDKKEIDKILSDSATKLSSGEYDIVKRIYDNYYGKYFGGDSFPIIKWANLDFMKTILQGTSWHGEVDLKNTAQLANFVSYVFQQ